MEPVLKEGVVEDPTNLERIAKLLRFSSTHTDSETQDVSLGDYVNRMKENQNKIYYVTADSFAAAKNSSHLEIFRDKGMADRIRWQAILLVPFAGSAVQRRYLGRLFRHQVCLKNLSEKMMIAIPLAIVIKRNDEQVGIIKIFQRVLPGW